MADASTLKLIWMSDPHFISTGTVQGHDPRLRMNAVVNHVNRHHSDAAYCVVSGDMVNDAHAMHYAGIKAHLDPLIPNLLPMVGNHDVRDGFEDVFGVPADRIPGFVQYQVTTNACRILCLDTLKSDCGSGELCAGRLQWLEDRLAEPCNIPTCIFMHHPPMDLGLPMQDQDKLENADAFLDLLTAAACDVYLFIGHVHRPISGVVRGIPFSTIRSVLYQAPAPVPAWDWTTFQPGQEAPQIGVIQIQNGSITVQYEQFCDYNTGVFSREGAQ